MAIPEKIPHIVPVEDLPIAENLANFWFAGSQNGITKRAAYDLLLSTINAAISGGAITGDIKMSRSSSPQTGWLLCDNTQYTQAAYPALYTICGGSGGFFRVPDMRGRVPVGAGTGIVHIGGSPNDPLTARTLGTYYGLEDSTDTDNATVTIGNTAATGTVSVTMNAITPSGTVSAPTFTGTIATLTGVVSITDPGHSHEVTTSPKTVTDGVAEAAENDTYTSSIETTGITAGLTMTPYTPAGTISTPTFVGASVTPTTSATGFTGTNHTHSGSATVTITNSTIQPMTALNFYIKT